MSANAARTTESQGAPNAAGVSGETFGPSCQASSRLPEQLALNAIGWDPRWFRFYLKSDENVSSLEKYTKAEQIDSASVTLAYHQVGETTQPQCLPGNAEYEPCCTNSRDRACHTGQRAGQSPGRPLR